MVANPEPKQTILNFHSQRSVLQSDARRTEASDLFEVQRWVARIRLKQGKVFVGQFTNGGRQPAIATPEPGTCKVIHSPVELPA